MARHPARQIPPSAGLPVDSGHAIWYEKGQRVFHVERPDLKGFVRWQLVRGRGNYHIRRRVSSVGGYLRLRVWTFRNSLARAGLLRAPAVLALIALSVCAQSAGYWLERRSGRGGGGEVA